MSDFTDSLFATTNAQDTNDANDWFSTQDFVTNQTGSSPSEQTNIGSVGSGTAPATQSSIASGISDFVGLIGQLGNAAGDIFSTVNAAKKNSTGAVTPTATANVNTSKYLLIGLAGVAIVGLVLFLRGK